jgi:three-Cys-motif partner protein
MKNKWNGNLNYIEICSGPGRCINRETGEEFDGTALCIVQHQAYAHIKKALFFDIDDIAISTLNKRLSELHIGNAEGLKGDYYDPQKLCDIIAQKIDPKSLNIVFLDPTDCSIPFSLLQNITSILPNVDFIINIATGTDFNRNIKNVLLNGSPLLRNKYSMFLGRDDFFNNPMNISLAKSDKHQQLRNNFREEYKASLATLGYQYCDLEKVEHYYEILFASKNETGLRFWQKAKSIKYDGQRKLSL